MIKLLKKYPPFKRIPPFEQICKVCGVVVSDRNHYLSPNHLMYLLFAKKESEILG